MPDPVSDFDDSFRNQYGAIRVSFVREKYNARIIDKDEVVELFKEWRDDSEYFILRGIITEPQSTLYGDSLDYIKEIYKFIKASKRGNDVYQHLVKDKLKILEDLHNVIFFDKNSADKRTSLLFVTLTYDTKKCSSDKAWKNIGKEFHLFHNNLRKQYGNVEICRTWESTGHYYPHVHCIILFWDTNFPVIEHKGHGGKTSYRIPYKTVQEISKYWHSNIDVQALSDTGGALQELTKYVTKDLCSEKGNKTNAMIWLHGKQAYSISKGFVKAICGWDIEFNEPTNYDLIDSMCNCNQDVIKWEFVGILRGKHLGFFDEIWSVDLKKPPPKLAEMLIREYERWKSLH